MYIKYCKVCPRQFVDLVFNVILSVRMLPISQPKYITQVDNRFKPIFKYIFVVCLFFFFLKTSINILYWPINKKTIIICYASQTPHHNPLPNQ